MERRDILEKVAKGELSPEEADEALRSLDERPHGEAGPAPEASTPPAPGAGRVRTVKIRGGFGAIIVEGDTTVTEAEVIGQHSMSVVDDTLVIDADQPDFGPGAFAIDLGPHRRRRVRKIHIGRGNVGASSLRVRMNPTLALEVKLDAGALAVHGIQAPIRARSAAGPVTIEDVVAPIDVGLNAGAVRVSGLFTHGDSRIRSDAGAVRVEIDPSSSVQVFGDSAVGRVALPGDDDERRKGIGARRHVVIGSGDATLRIETAMGSINVTTDE